MKAVKFIIALALAAGLLITVFVNQAMADTAEQSQHLNQTYDVTCNTSGYGQSSCHVLGTQTADQSQKIVLRAGVKPVGKLADTGLDTAMTAGSVLTVGAGLAAAALKAKFRV